MNHRFGLFDRILIKDNHLAALRLEPPNAIEAAVRRARGPIPAIGGGGRGGQAGTSRAGAAGAGGHNIGLTT